VPFDCAQGDKVVTKKICESVAKEILNQVQQDKFVENGL